MFIFVNFLFIGYYQPININNVVSERVIFYYEQLYMATNFGSMSIPELKLELENIGTLERTCREVREV